MSSSFHELLRQLQHSENDAANEVVSRYASRLVALARARLSKRFQSRVDPEDVLQSVFRTFFRRQREGEFQLEGWDSLWSLLVVITLRKCGHQVERLQAGKRDVRREATVGAMEGDSGAEGEWQLEAHEPQPEEVAALTEMLEGLLSALNEQQREIVTLRLQGYTIAEVAEKVGRAERGVYRLLAEIRQRLAEWQIANS